MSVQPDTLQWGEAPAKKKARRSRPTFRNAFQLDGYLRNEATPLEEVEAVEEELLQTKLLPPGPNTYTWLLQRCSLSEERLDRMYRQMLKCPGFVPNRFQFNTAISGYAWHGRADLAAEVFEQMKRTRVGPDASTFGSLFSACATACDAPKATYFFEQAKLTDIEINSQAYTGYIAALGKAGAAEAALAAYAEMNANHIPPNVEIFQSIIEACSKAGRGSEALAIFGDMVKRGVLPEMTTFTFLIEACSRAQLGRKMYEVFQLLRTHYAHIPPEPETFAALFDGCARCGLGAEAHAAFRDMKACGVSPTAAVFDNVIDACAKAGLGLEALEVFSDMPFYAVRPTLFTFNRLIWACAKARLVDDALRVARQLEAYELQPNIYTFANLAEACAVAGKGPEALRIYSEMKERGMVLDPRTVARIIDACARAGLVAESLTVFDEVQQRLPTLDTVCCNAALEACAQGRLAQEALRLFTAMRPPAAAPDAVTLDRVVRACAQGEGGIADVVRAVAERDCPAARRDQALWLLRACAAHALGPEACVVFEAVRSSVAEALGPAVYAALFDALARSRMAAEALRYWSELPADGAPLGAEELIHLLTACADAGDLAGARRVFGSLAKPPVAVVSAMVIVEAMFANAGAAGRLCDGLEPPSADCLSAVFQAALREAKQQVPEIEAATAAFEKRLQTHGAAKTADTYAAVVGALAEAGRFTKALELITEMEKQGLRPTAKLWMALLCAGYRHDATAICVHALERLKAAPRYAPAANTIVARLHQRLGKLLPAGVGEAGGLGDWAVATCYVAGRKQVLTPSGTAASALGSDLCGHAEQSAPVKPGAVVVIAKEQGTCPACLEHLARQSSGATVRLFAGEAWHLFEGGKRVDA